MEKNFIQYIKECGGEIKELNDEIKSLMQEKEDLNKEVKQLELIINNKNNELQSIRKLYNETIYEHDRLQSDYKTLNDNMQTITVALTNIIGEKEKKEDWKTIVEITKR